MKNLKTMVEIPEDWFLLILLLQFNNIIIIRLILEN